MASSLVSMIKTKRMQMMTWMTFLRIVRTVQVKLVQVDPVMKRRRITLIMHTILLKLTQGWGSQAQVGETTHLKFLLEA
jgi:hypothetical protein